MENTFKSLTTNSRTATIVLDRFNSNSDRQLKALAVLLGGYNKFGRNIALNKHRENMKVFFDLVEKVVNDLESDKVFDAANYILDNKIIEKHGTGPNGVSDAVVDKQRAFIMDQFGLNYDEYSDAFRRAEKLASLNAPSAELPPRPIDAARAFLFSNDPDNAINI